MRNLPDNLPAVHRSIRFARISLRIAGFFSLAGCLFGLVFAGASGQLTPVEWLTMPPMMIISLAVIVGLHIADGTRTYALGLVFIAFGCFYILANTGGALFLLNDPARAIIYISWTPVVYLFSMAVLRSGQAKALCWTSVTTLYLFVALLISQGRFGPPGTSIWIDILYVLLLIQPAMVLLIFGIGEFREDYFAERIRSEHLDQNRSALTEAVRLAETRSAEAIETNAAKSRFLAGMSHEFRTPLNAIIGLTEVIKARNEAQETHRDDGAINAISHSGQLLLSLVNDILDLSKLESGEVKLYEEEIVLSTLLQGCIQICIGIDFDNLSERIVIEHDPNLPTLFADPTRVTQMIVNLLSNALKFSDTDTPISLRAHVLPDNTLAMEVEDRGIGIAEDQIPHLMDPFYQVDDTTTRKHRGTGLGLAIVANLIKRHGGALKINSRLGHGTCMTLIFPANRLSGLGRT